MEYQKLNEGQIKINEGLIKKLETSNICKFMNITLRFPKKKTVLTLCSLRMFLFRTVYQIFYNRVKCWFKCST